MSMSKKYYQAIARGLHDMNLDGRNTVDYRDVIAALCMVFSADNDKFDRFRFAEACLTGKCKGMKGDIVS